MIDLIKKIQDFKLTRRSFIGWTAATAAVAAIPVTRGLVAHAQANGNAQAANSEGVWKTAACWHDCGGRCLNKVLVKDGGVIRQKTDDTHEDSVDFPQQRGCLRGRSQRKQVFGADRLKYPMKRKNWQVGGGKKELRGKDQWVRISWDEALNTVASEIKRISKKYGNESIWASGYDGWGEHVKMLSMAGGCVTDWRTASYGAFYKTAPLLGMADGWELTSVNDKLDLVNSQLIVLWGNNPSWSSPGTPVLNFLNAKKAGAKFITVNPTYTDSNGIFDADWIPVRPGTDDALLLAIMNALLEKDDPILNPLIDWDVLYRCTVGFDKDHMPTGANPKDNFKDYLLGTYDQQPKTPEWAAEICGVEAQTIRELAQLIGGTKRAAILCGWAPARINNGDSFVQAFNTLGFMTGHIGRSGRMTGISVHALAANGGPSLVVGGSDGLPVIENPVNISISTAQIFKAITDGKYLEPGKGEKPINIQMVYHEQQALNGMLGIKQGLEAIRTVEFVVSNSYVLTTSSKYADIVLPITTQWEREGGVLSGNREILIAFTKIIEPMFEAKSDQWVATELMKRLGLDPKKVYPFSEKQQFFNTLAGATVVKENGVDYEPLVTITGKDLKDWGVDGTPQKGRITLNEFIDRGIYQVKRKQGDQLGYIAYQQFIENPKANPLPSESGKFEIYCKALAEESKGLYSEVAPIPKYVPKVNGYEATYQNWEKRIKGKYPFQVINPHYLRRAHSTFDNIPNLRKAWPNPVYLNKTDADKLNIKTGDTVLLSNAYGKTLRPAYTTETIRPGVVALPHGAWLQINEQNGIDQAGADNMLTAQITTGLGVEGFNTVVCNVEKWTGAPLKEDYKWEQRIIKFN